MTQPTFIDLFAGLGGFRLGMETQGFTCLYGSDSDQHAAATYQLNFGEDIHSDITLLEPETLPDFDVLCGGSPCQPFSRAGKGLGFEDTRGTLFFNLCHIIQVKQPKVVFLENVKNLYNHDGGNTFRTIISSLEQLGYTVAAQILNAVDYNVPQSRERVIIVATKGEKQFDFTKVATSSRKPLRDFLDPDPLPENTWLPEERYTLLEPNQTRQQPKTGLQFVGYLNRNQRTAGVKENTSHLSRAHKQASRIYADTGSHPTLNSQETAGRYYIHTPKPDGTMGVRKLTMNECYRIFGYPETYQRTGPVTSQYRRIGNSIPVPLVAAVAGAIRSQLFPNQP